MKKNILAPELYLKEMTMSISGWRKVFAQDGNDENPTKKIGADDEHFLILLAYFLLSHFLGTSFSEKPRRVPTPNSNSRAMPKTILLARDSRPTGNKIEQIFTKVFTLHKVNFISLGINGLPEVLAAVRSKARELSGFVYFTASHNPVGYNGIKIGGNDGKVLNATKSNQLINSFKEFFLNPKKTAPVIDHYFKEKLGSSPSLSRDSQGLKSKINKSGINDRYQNYRSLTHTAYEEQIIKVAFLGRKKILEDFKRTDKEKVVCDFNGSSRINSGDKTILKNLNIDLIAMNKKLGHFPHQIVPEGKGLDQVKNYLLENFNKKILFGYSVDCDGDRGNFVFYAAKDKVVVPTAQTSFLLMVISELIFLKEFFTQKKNAIIINGPTSLNVDRIAKLFQVDVFRAEVGEANVLALGEAKRKAGYEVRILGEGSNGGSILFPSQVRDPLTTLLSYYKLLYLKNKGTTLKEKLIEHLNLPKKLTKLNPQFFFFHLMKELNYYSSTSLFDRSGTIKFKPPVDQKKLKANYEKLFQETYQQEKKLFNALNVTDFDFVNYEGMETKLGEGNRSDEASGGLKVLLKDNRKLKVGEKAGEEVGFLWFRGSKTEPIFRLSAEIISSKKKFLKDLLKLQRNLLTAAAASDANNKN